MEEEISSSTFPRSVEKKSSFISVEFRCLYVIQAYYLKNKLSVT